MCIQILPPSCPSNSQLWLDPWHSNKTYSVHGRKDHKPHEVRIPAQHATPTRILQEISLEIPHPTYVLVYPFVLAYLTSITFATLECNKHVLNTGISKAIWPHQDILKWLQVDWIRTTDFYSEGGVSAFSYMRTPPILSGLTNSGIASSTCQDCLHLQSIAKQSATASWVCLASWKYKEGQLLRHLVMFRKENLDCDCWSAMLNWLSFLNV